MNAYLILIGIISAISCVLIMVCINSKSREFPHKDSLSPLGKQGLSQKQKSHLLLVICIIFFLSLVIADIKSSKFKIMYNQMFSKSSQITKVQSYRVNNFDEILYGKNKNCIFQLESSIYPFMRKYLTQTNKYEKLVNLLIKSNYHKYQMIESESSEDQKNSRIQSNKFYKENQQQLILFYSSQKNLGAEVILPQLSQKICKNQLFQSQFSKFTPIFYLNLDKDQHIINEQELMQQIHIQDYENLKYSLCNLNGIQIKKQQIKYGSQKNSIFYQKQTFIKNNELKEIQRRNVYLVINNFLNILDTLIVQQWQNIQEKTKNENGEVQSKDKTFQTKKIGQKYQLFIGKLFNQLIKECKVNVILHTQNKNSLKKVYQKWNTLSKSEHSLQKRFPFSIRQWQGLTKIDFYNLVKQMIDSDGPLRTNNRTVLKTFDKYFGSVIGPNKNEKKMRIIGQDKKSGQKFYENYQYLLFDQIQQFFKSIDEQISGKSILKGKSSVIQIQLDAKTQVASHYGLREFYQIVKKMYYLSIQNKKSLQIGSVKKKVNLKDLDRLQQLNLVSIKNGVVALVK